MAKDLKTILVVDLESTCWEGNPPPGQKNEIIEIGYAILHKDADGKSWQIGTGDHLVVKPTTSKVSEFCTKLTGWTQEQIDASGMSFQEACKQLKERFDPKQLTWASYGDYDRRQFERQCADEKVGYPFGVTHLNVKNLFALKMKLPREVGMAEALQHLGKPLEGRHHSGKDDAMNIAGILQQLLG